MNKKYQDFVSSTYADLREHRQEVMNALLELDCIPAGMELFPAANEDQWSLIKGVIDDCDYYIVISAGRYGSIGPDGIGYTEMEYRYAAETGKPIIAFLHKDPDILPKKDTENDENGQDLLAQFRELMKKRMCKFWDTPQNLGSVVSRSLIMLQRKHPGIGWVRGDLVPDTDSTEEILKLRKKIETLNSQLQTIRTILASVLAIALLLSWFRDPILRRISPVVISWERVESKQDLEGLLDDPCAIVFIRADWSISSAFAKREIDDFVFDWQWNNRGPDLTFYLIDHTDSTPSWLIEWGESNGKLSCIHNGYGETVWLKGGEVLLRLEGQRHSHIDLRQKAVELYGIGD